MAVNTDETISRPYATQHYCSAVGLWQWVLAQATELRDMQPPEAVSSFNLLYPPLSMLRVRKESIAHN